MTRLESAIRNHCIVVMHAKGERRKWIAYLLKTDYEAVKKVLQRQLPQPQELNDSRRIPQS